MKKVFLALLLIAGVTFGAVAQTQNTKNATEQKTKGTQAVITFEKTTHDYGEIQKGANGVCEFKYKNTGKAPLILSSVRSSCGCTVPSWSKEPIMPGKTGVIKVKYDTNRVGPINKTITVQSNASNDRELLKIIGKVGNNPAK